MIMICMKDSISYINQCQFWFPSPPVHEPAHVETAEENAPAGKRNYLVGESISIVC